MEYNNNNNCNSHKFHSILMTDSATISNDQHIKTSSNHLKIIQIFNHCNIQLTNKQTRE